MTPSWAVSIRVCMRNCVYVCACDGDTNGSISMFAYTLAMVRSYECLCIYCDNLAIVKLLMCFLIALLLHNVISLEILFCCNIPGFPVDGEILNNLAFLSKKKKKKKEKKKGCGRGGGSLI